MDISKAMRKWWYILLSHEATKRLARASSNANMLLISKAYCTYQRSKTRRPISAGYRRGYGYNKCVHLYLVAALLLLLLLLHGLLHRKRQDRYPDTSTHFRSAPCRLDQLTWWVVCLPPRCAVRAPVWMRACACAASPINTINNLTVLLLAPCQTDSSRLFTEKKMKSFLLWCHQRAWFACLNQRILIWATHHFII